MDPILRRSQTTSTTSFVSGQNRTAETSDRGDGANRSVAVILWSGADKLSPHANRVDKDDAMQQHGVGILCFRNMEQQETLQQTLFIMNIPSGYSLEV